MAKIGVNRNSRIISRFNKPEILGRYLRLSLSDNFRRSCFLLLHLYFFDGTKILNPASRFSSTFAGGRFFQSSTLGSFNRFILLP